TETRMDIDGLEWLKDKTITAENLTRVEKLAPIAKQLGISLPVLAIAWCLKNPNVSTVMLGASKVSQLEENLTAVAKKHLLTTEVMQEIELALNNTPIRPNF
ncbi:MAG: aldo/keto reductase, partial [Crocinitomix sp.]|nr:aldo/keto reductase [Crocinitomix sp.]